MTTGLLTPPDVSPLPIESYRHLPDSGLEQRISQVKSELGESLLILGHHYQQDEVIRFADLRGDSLKLSQLAAGSQNCRSIVFCGVHFMAETADILSRHEVQVFLPDLSAGCSMADMADLDSVEAAWDDLGEIIDTNDLMPVTYINSTADLKAFCGRHGGIVCTSSNARAVLDWALASRRRALFFPDQHLGRNTARTMGIPLEQMVDLGSPSEPWAAIPRRPSTGRGSCSGRATARSTRCSNPGTSTQFRHQFPGIQILVHPECMMEVVDAGRPRRLDRVHHPDHRTGPRRLELGHRDRAPPGQPARSRAPRQDHPFSFPHGLHVRHHVPDRSAPPGVVPREPGPGNAREPDPSRVRNRTLGQNCS